MDAYETIDYKGCTIEIHVDEDAENPFSAYDQAGKLYGDSDQSDGVLYGAEAVNLEYCEGWAEWLKDYNESERVAFAIPVRIDDYGSSGYQMWFDGSVRPGDEIEERFNYLYLMTRKTVLYEYSSKIITPKVRARAESLARAELKEYEYWVEGYVYGYIAKDEHGETLESVWGFLGEYDEDDGPVSEAKSVIDNYTETRKSKAALAALAGI